MALKDAPPTDEILDYIRIEEELKNKIGIICLNCIFILSKMEDIFKFIEEYNIDIPKKNVHTKLELLKYTCHYFYTIYLNNEQIQNNFDNPLSYISSQIINSNPLNKYLYLLDFISKQELKERFADWCADLGITVYDTEDLDENYTLDQYLIRRTPLLRTETVYIRTGHELDQEEYLNTIQLIKKSSKISTWNVFVTTPLGILNIGLNKIIEDMEELNIWLYVVDPVRKKIFGITKGKKSDDYDSDLRDQFIKKLPKEPMRAQSRLKEISSFQFEENKSYDPESYIQFDLIDILEHDKILTYEKEPRYKSIFKNLIIIEKSSGIPFFSYASKDLNKDVLFSGFLTAMDDFVSQIGGDTTLQEINYKNFIVQAVYGKYIKIALFMSQKGDRALKERLEFFIEFLEEKYENKIKEFKKTGDTSDFNDNEILEYVKLFLEI
ncbi:MAG: hypothetical protein GF317_20875 [Candidatus Lokiarchaeota archaeon]|nr:hypothetical protein [Candidatus Lokiarchaeota archaeon]MBD3201899.1 hypothetical protein [Candidatus Lokiarchaeota archaeon]